MTELTEFFFETYLELQYGMNDAIVAHYSDFCEELMTLLHFKLYTVGYLASLIFITLIINFYGLLPIAQIPNELNLTDETLKNHTITT
jgi:hypothetical protein